MPQPGKRWRFVTIGTHNAWRPGDKRGWRSRKHKRHSSGDYKNPPPPEEHQGLRQWVNARAGESVIISGDLRDVVGAQIIQMLTELGHRVLGISVSGCHSHILVELPDDVAEIKAIVGEAKRVSSRAVRKEMPGRIWAGGGDFDPVDTKPHLAAALNYILTKQGPGAWTWSYHQPRPAARIINGKRVKARAE
jgi:REP element-mobilizing transposase RayT